MSFHDRGFNSRNGFDSQSSRVPVLSYDRGNDVLRRGGVSPGPILECDDIQIQSPGVTQRIRSGRVMTGGPPSWWGLARSNIRVCGHLDPVTRGYPAHSVLQRAARGSFGIDTHGHRSDFCQSVVLPLCYNCTRSRVDRISGSSYSIREVSRAIIAQW
jgi:hypothetical protein